MSDRKSEREEFAGLIDSLCEGDLTEVGWLRIRELVCAHSAFRDEYVNAIQLIAGLELECADDAAQEAVANLQHKRTAHRKPVAPAVLFPNQLPDNTSSGGPSTGGTTPHPTWFSALRPSSSRSRSWFDMVAGALASVVLMAVLAFASWEFRDVLWSHEEQTTSVPVAVDERPNGAFTSETIDAKYVATLRASSDALWHGSTLPTTPGSRLVLGRLHLNSGTAEVAFDQGAVVILEGPAWLELQSINSGVLHRGKLIAHVPPAAIGFTIRTPTTTVVDFGTDFGIVAGALGETEVHVFNGEVELMPRSVVMDPISRRRLIEGQAASLELLPIQAQSPFQWHQFASRPTDFSHLGMWVSLQNATATIDQKNFSIPGLLDSSGATGWSTSVDGKNDSALNPTVFVQTDSDIGYAGGTRLTFTLNHQGSEVGHNLRHFRLAATTVDRDLHTKQIPDGDETASKWIILDPLSYQSSGGATIVELSDHSLLVSGVNPGHDTYTITTRTSLMGITGFRLEAMASGNAVIVHRYDFEPDGPSPRTQDGWTHIGIADVGDATTFGFLPASAGSQLVSFDRGFSSQSPTPVTQDAVLSRTQPTADPVMIFRDIIPASATSVQLMIYRSDPGDTFAPDFITKACIDGGAPAAIDNGISTDGRTFPPIAQTIALSGSPSFGTLDLQFFDGSQVRSSRTRISGIEATYFIPEDSARVPKTNGPGRAASGDFMLTRFALMISPVDIKRAQQQAQRGSNTSSRVEKHP